MKKGKLVKRARKAMSKKKEPSDIALSFIKGLARAGAGASAFIYPGERIEPKVLSLFGKVGQAGLEDAWIGWGAGEAEQALARQHRKQRFPGTPRQEPDGLGGRIRENKSLPAAGRA